MNDNAIVPKVEIKEIGVWLDDAKIQLLKDTICKGITNDEFELFKYVAKCTGLDPFLKQIMPVKRWDSKLGREAMSIQTGIDGYRLIADRTGRYAPGRESTYEYKADGTLLSATSYVKKLTADGVWHEVACTAFFEEYVQRTREGKVTSFWGTKPHVMLAKVAESAALRKAFPADLSGIYTSEEMPMAQDNAPVVADVTPLTKMQFDIINDLIGEDEEYRKQVIKHLETAHGVKRLEDAPNHLYVRLVNAAKANFEKKNKAKAVEAKVEEETEVANV